MTQKKHYKPKLDPDVDLAGATPETLALALLGRKPKLQPDAGNQPVVGDEPLAVREAPPPEPGSTKHQGGVQP